MEQRVRFAGRPPAPVHPGPAGRDPGGRGDGSNRHRGRGARSAADQARHGTASATAAAAAR